MALGAIEVKGPPFLKPEEWNREVRASGSILTQGWRERMPWVVFADGQPSA